MIKNILVIEDDRFIGEMYIRSLKKACYNVDWAIDGNDGIVMARNKKYDLLLIDIMLPEKKGDEIVSSIKQYIDKDTKIIIMTNFQQDETSKNNLLSQVDDYFIKADTTPRKLVDMIQKI